MGAFFHALAIVSTFIVGLFPTGQTLSYIAPPLPILEKQTTTILFGGDMMFDRTIREIAKKHGNDYLFECLDPAFTDSDLVVANLEGPITENKSKSVGTTPEDLANFMFTFPTSTAQLLARHKVSLVNIGNNHILNFGWRGLASTTEWLTDANVDYFGDPKEQRVAHKVIHGMRFAFVNYNEFAPPPFSASTTIEQIQDARIAGEMPVVFTHWGEEYKPATKGEKKLAHEFVDAGAEIVIGTHPHIVQEHELYVSSSTASGKGKYIYYSLGNLIFDQYWMPSVRDGLLVQVVFDKDGVKTVTEKGVQLKRDANTCVVL